VVFGGLGVCGGCTDDGGCGGSSCGVVPEKGWKN
jgi:hypothetical protein